MIYRFKVFSKNPPIHNCFYADYFIYSDKLFYRPKGYYSGDDIKRDEMGGLGST